MRMNLKRSRKSNSVSWASGVNIRQVKLFSSDDCPVKVGQKYQDHLQAKASSILKSIPVEDDLPPGFEGGFYVSRSTLELSHIPRIQWKSPSKFVMNNTWQVAAGEESEEAKAQQFREMKVLEAVYPRFSAIPPTPSVSLDVEGEHYDDSLTPSVPNTPIEEECPDLPSDLETLVDTTVDSQPPALPQGLAASGNSNASKSDSPALQQLAIDQSVLENLLNQNADVTAAVSAAFTAILKSAEKGSLVDTGLLIRILSDPKMLQKLIKEHGLQANAGVAPTNNLTAPFSKTMVLPVPSSLPKSETQSTVPVSKATVPPVPSSLPKSETQTTASISKTTVPPVPASPPISDMQSTAPRSKTTIPPVPSSLPISDIPRTAGKNFCRMPGTMGTTLYTIPRQPGNVQLSGLNRPAPSPPFPSPQSNFFTLPLLPNQNHAPPSAMTHPNGAPLPPFPVSAMAQPNRAPLPPFPVMEAGRVRDVNYYKYLIMQHGVPTKVVQNPIFTQQNGNNHNHLTDLKMVQNFNTGEVKPKNPKPCIYFKTPKGCRNGANCNFQHDMSFQLQSGNIVKANKAKRMKLSAVNT